jgi:hypothetical protein
VLLRDPGGQFQPAAWTASLAYSSSGQNSDANSVSSGSSIG